MLLSLLLAQGATSLPDIEINTTIRARSLTIQQRGDASVTIRSEPEGANLVDVQAPKANGRATIRNVAVDVRAEARIADPQVNSPAAATTPPN